MPSSSLCHPSRQNSPSARYVLSWCRLRAELQTFRACSRLTDGEDLQMDMGQ